MQLLGVSTWGVCKVEIVPERACTVATRKYVLVQVDAGMWDAGIQETRVGGRHQNLDGIRTSMTHPLLCTLCSLRVLPQLL